MLKRVFNLYLPHLVVVYLRMSSDKQNPRSPDQQLEEIERRIKALGYRWIIVKVYRDDGISGRYLRKRTAYQAMLRDIKSGAVSVDLILVDTLERFGRVEDLPGIRKDLYEKHGVLVLTADSSFADPTTPQGKALGMFEAHRAHEDERIKAHNVFRGKRDSVLLKRWPGGPPPFGYKLQSLMKTVQGREEVDYCVLVPNPETRWIIEELFMQAHSTSWGTTRLSKWLNQHPDIPEKFKPFNPATVGYWLDNHIYFGEFIWAENSTGIVDDTRIVERNSEEVIIRVPEFCEPLLARDIWDRYQAIRQVRRDQHAAALCHQTKDNGKQIAPLARGLTLKYLLSGLLYCECGLRMTASSTSEYTNKAGDARRYVSYVCPGYLAGHCPNGTRVPEQWIRESVIAKLRERLFPRPA